MTSRGRATPVGLATGLTALVAAVIGAFCTVHLWGDPGGRMVSGNLPDAVHYSWWLGHTPSALAHGANPLRTTQMNWPQGVSAMNNTTLMLPAVVLSPLTAAVNSLATLNLLNVLAVPICVVAAYWVLRRIPGEPLGRPAALVGAVAFGISPAIVNSLVGHVTMAFAPLLPVLLLLGVRTWTSDRPVRTGLALGLVATAQVFIGEEVLFQAGMASLLVVLVAAFSRGDAVPVASRRAVRALGTALAVLVVVGGYPIHEQFRGPLHQHGSPFLLDYYGADLHAFTTATDRVLLHTAGGAAQTAGFPGGVEEHLAYLGWPLLITCLVVAVVGWRRVAVRCAAVGMAVCLALSLGGLVWVGGRQSTVHGPYALLQILPVTEASLATRFAVVVAAFAAFLLARGVHALLAGEAGRVRLPRPARAAGGAVLAGACLAPLVPAALPVVDAPEVPAYFTSSALERYGRDDVMLVLPYPTPTNPWAMRWQTASGYRFSMPGGYFLGPDANGQAFVGGGPARLTASRLSMAARTGIPVEPTPRVRAGAAADFAAWRPKQVVVGPAPGYVAVRESVVGLLGPPTMTQGGVDIWTNPVVRP